MMQRRAVSIWRLSKHAVCSQCGAALSPGARYCESCGEPAGGNTVVPGEKAPPSDCPKCGKSDQSFTAQDFCAKAISDAEEKEADAADKWGPTYAQLMLEEPEPPQPPDLGLWLIVPFIPLVNFIACWFAPMRKGHKFFMLGIVTVFWACVFVHEICKTSAYAFVGCFFVLFYYAALFLDRDRQKALYLTQRLPEYNKARPRWEHLYYCQRCEVVWLDNEPGKHAGVDKTPELMNS